MKIDPGGRTVQGLNTFFAFIGLNVLFLISCLPVITCGAAISSLYQVMMRFTDDERGDLLRDFVRAFPGNLWRGTAVLVILGVPTLLLAVAARFWFLLGSTFSLAAMMLAIVGAFYMFTALLYALALVAAFRAPVLRTVRNALLLPGAEPLRSLGLALIPVTTVSLVLTVPVTMFLLLTIGFSLGAYGSAFLLISVFSRHDSEPGGA